MARKKTPAQSVSAAHDVYVEQRLVELETFLQSSESKRNAAAFVAGTRLATTLKAELEEIRHPKGSVPTNPAEGLTDEDLLVEICKAIAELPDAAVDRLEEALRTRRTGRPSLRVVES